MIRLPFHGSRPIRTFVKYVNDYHRPATKDSLTTVLQETCNAKVVNEEVWGTSTRLCIEFDTPCDYIEFIMRWGGEAND